MCVCAIIISDIFITVRVCVCVCVRVRVREGMYMSLCELKTLRSHASGTNLSIANKKKFSKGRAQ